MKKFQQVLCFFLLLTQICFAQLNLQTTKTNSKEKNELFNRQDKQLPIFNRDFKGRLPDKFLSPYHRNQLLKGTDITDFNSMTNFFHNDRFLVNGPKGRTYPYQMILSPKSQIYVIDTAFVLQVEDGILPAETSRHICSFNAGAKRTIELKQILISGSWMNDFCRTTTYDASNNMIMDLWEWWTVSQWINGYRHTYTYDTQGNMITDLGESWESGQWINGDRHTYTYDTQGNMLTGLGEGWENGQWNNSWLQTFTYDSQGNMLTALLEWWENNQWKNGWRNTYTYDTQGNMLTDLGENWENGQWMNSWLQTFAYDTQGNLISFWLHTWFESSWIPANINNYGGWVMYDMAGNEYHFWGHNFTFVYKLIVTDVKLESVNVPEHYALWQNYPNPFNSSTKIRYSIPHTSNVVIKVFDILGNQIQTLVKEEKPAGNYEITWNAGNLPGGVYFYQLTAGDFIQTKKMILLR